MLSIQHQLRRGSCGDRGVLILLGMCRENGLCLGNIASQSVNTDKMGSDFNGSAPDWQIFGACGRDALGAPPSVRLF